jgi:methionyl-tRNA formyltransferase
MNKRSVVLISPNAFSHYSSKVAIGLIKKDIHIAAIITVKLLNIRRIAQELKSGKLSLLKKIYEKVLFRDKITINEGQGLKKNASSMYKISQNYNIPLHFVDSVNSLSVENILKSSEFELVVFTGGGIIKLNILKLANRGIVNCHSGILPDYRGMDCHKWAILNDELDKVGVSCHFMSEKVDRGDLIRTRKLNVTSSDSISDIERRIEVLMGVEIVSAVSDYLLQKAELVKQKIENGSNYYTMHDSLELLVNKKIKNIK